MLPQTLILACFLYGAATASNPECVSGINLALGYFKFGSATGEVEEYGASHCSNKYYVHSVWAAAKLYCNEEDIAYGETYLRGQCEYYGLGFPTYTSVSANLTETYIDSLPVVTYNDIESAPTFNTSIIVSESLARNGIRTLTVFDTFILDYNIYGWIIIGYWGLILVAGMANRLLLFILDSRQSQIQEVVEASSNPASGKHGIFPSPRHWIHTNIILPATFGTYRQRLWWGCMLPTRLEFIVLVVYYLLTIAFCSVTYEVFDPNLYYTHNQQIWRYFSDRTGALSYTNLVFLWLFAGRNNIFIWATGWKFSTFNLFHRHIARVTTILAIAHSIGYTIFCFVDGGGYASYSASFKEVYWVMGTVATITMSLMLPFSSILLRRYSYEIFLLAHIALSLATLVALFYHTHFYDVRTWDVYLWPVVAVWSFERFLRTVRWGYCNYHVSLTKGLITTKATASYSQEADLITLEIAPGAHHLKPGPSQHYFIYQWNVWRGWENHPFSLASWKQDSSTSDCEIPMVTVGPDVKAESNSGTSQSVTVESLSSIKSPPQFTFYIRPSNGFTGRLRKQCLKSSNSIPLKILFEGPYGHTFPADTYDTLVLVAGGSGIAGVLPYLKTYQRNSRTTRIRLIWTTKQVAMITEISQRELVSRLAHADFERSFYVTGEISALGIKNSELGLDIQYGRPDVKALLSQEVWENGQTRTAVIACGPPGMADEARDCVHALLKQGFRNLEYVEESFGW